ncbi:uncharacterized protein LOC133077674 [Eubalaena glacialis]|uniref:uncharacterized protein LOC133077666 n=1 Tax=Eubalaena glacialis TaxID=27606 RepID=UPI002A59E26F|nr:uncharacterized protein LOC133077666 [Eubalaena glacialis]XP_061028440.1 uncharacterized protein LOC133077674 [Eubalaena glacialis]
MPPPHERTLPLNFLPCEPPEEKLIGEPSPRLGRVLGLHHLPPRSGFGSTWRLATSSSHQCGGSGSKMSTDTDSEIRDVSNVRRGRLAHPPYFPPSPSVLSLLPRPYPAHSPELKPALQLREQKHLDPQRYPACLGLATSFGSHWRRRQPSTGGSLPSDQAGADNRLGCPGFPGQAPPAAPVPLEEARAPILQCVQHMDGSKDK